MIVYKDKESVQLAQSRQPSMARRFISIVGLLLIGVVIFITLYGEISLGNYLITIIVLMLLGAY